MSTEIKEFKESTVTQEVKEVKRPELKRIALVPKFVLSKTFPPVMMLQVGNQIHDIEKLYKCTYSKDYDFVFCIETKEKPKSLIIGDQFFSGGESTKVMYVETKHDIFIIECIRGSDDLWSGLLQTAQEFPGSHKHRNYSIPDSKQQIIHQKFGPVHGMYR